MSLKKRIALSGIWLFLAASLSMAAVHESLQPWHWSMAYIQALQARGGFQELSVLNRPYTRGEIAAGLIELRKSYQMRRADPLGKAQRTETEQKLLNRLWMEFEPEIRVLTSKDSSENTLEAGLHFFEAASGASSSDTKVKGIFRSRVSAPIGNHLTLYNGMNLDQTRVDDPLYSGKKWKDLTYFTEQAYISGVWDRARIKFGRDFLRWGDGRTGTLLFSDVCRPMDQILGSFDLGPFRYTFVTAFLDPMTFPREVPDSLSMDDGRVERYMSAHRLNARLFKGKFEIAFTEAVLYGGMHRPADWVYMNPFALYHGEQLDRGDRANTLGTVDVFVRPARKWQVYGSLLIDDIQVEKKVIDDLEPDEIGWMAGMEWADALDFNGFSLFGEYCKVTNRTYKTPYPWETAAFQAVPLGHPSGNDFDLWTAGCSQWIGSGVLLGLSYGRARKGEGSLFSEWDTPWRSSTMSLGYSEPFPTGTVLTEDRLGISIDYRSSSVWGLSGRFQSVKQNNAGHVKGRRSNSTEWKLGVWLDWDKVVRF